MLLELQHLAVRLGKRSVLKDVSLSVSGHLTYLIGKNGSGKTTLLRAIAGELSYQGSITLDGQSLLNLSPRQRARQMALVHQRSTFPFQVSVFDFVLMGRYPYLSLLGNYSPADRKQADWALERMSLEPFRDRFLDEVSGGELQRVLIARALCQDAPWFLMDEPAQQLDPLYRCQLYELLADLAKEGRQIVCTSHDREAVEQTGAHIIGLRDGAVTYNTAKGNWKEAWDAVYAEG